MALRHVFFPTWHRPAPHPAKLSADTELAALRAVPGVRVWLARLGRIGLTLGLLACAEDVGRRGIAEWYYNVQTLDGLRRAVRWCPESARYLGALADALDNSAIEGAAGEAVRLSEKATR